LSKVATAALGAFNRFVGLPALAGDAAAAADADAPRRFVLVLRIEALSMLAILLAATVLGSTAPA
jgi:hypothetical protein